MDKLQATGTEQDDFDDAELEELYSWVDGFNLSRPKKNIARDFSDGVLVAEIVKTHFPNIVELHNYTAANSAGKKEENWLYLNRKVFSKLNFELAKDVVRDVVNCKPGVIEKVLMMLRIKLNRAEWELQKHPPPPVKKKGYGRSESDKPEADQYVGSPGRGKGHAQKGGKGQKHTGASSQRAVDHPKEIITLDSINNRPEYWPDQPKSRIIKNIQEADTVPRILYEEKAQECLAKDETIKILQAKINRMEHLIHLKDVRIEDLQGRVEAMRPTGVRR